MNKNVKRISLIMVFVIILFAGCIKKTTQPVAGPEQEQTAMEDTDDVDIIIGEDSLGEEPTKAPTEESTNEQPTIETTEPSSESEEDTGYIYYQVMDDIMAVKALGDIKVTEAELLELTELLKSYDKNIAFKAVSVDGTKCLSYNSRMEFFAASAVKAPYLLYCYKQMDAGNGTLEETMAYTSKYFYEGTGEIKDSPEGTIYPLGEVLRRVIWNSDNSAYFMCADRWGKEGYNELMESIGCDRLKFNNYSVWVHNTRPEDFVIVWKHIYEYFNEDTVNAKAFYDSCTNCKWSYFGGGIPKTEIAEKYGWDVDVFCNSGIVYGENGTYILSMFTSSAGEVEDRNYVSQVVSKIHAIMNKQEVESES